MSGYIKLHRKLRDWEWYDDHNATRLLVHLLISVNYKTKRWKGIDIPAGSMVLSWSRLSKGCGMSVQECRTAMKKLEISKEVLRKSTNKFQVVSLIKWDKMQIHEITATDNQQTDQQSSNKQLTTTKEYKEYKERKNNPLNPPLKKNGTIIGRFTESDFISDWNRLRTQHLGRPSYLKRIGGPMEVDLFKSLSRDYSREEFGQALIGLFKQRNLPRGNESMQSSPRHFLNNFERYLTAYHDKNQKIYGDD